MARAPDPGYPYPGAIIGTPGYDVFNQGEVQTYAPSAWNDVMAYCGNSWVSDYSYKKVLDYRLSGQDPTLKAVAGPTAVEAGKRPQTEDCLLVQGTINALGELTIGSSFIVNTVPDEEEKEGTYLLELKDAKGATQVRFHLEPLRTAHAQGVGFCKAISLKCLKPQGLAGPSETPTDFGIRELIVSRNGEILGQKRGKPNSHAMMAMRQDVVEPNAARLDANTVRFTWDASAHPTVMIRNEKREVISFATGGSIHLATDANRLEVSFSDSLTSITQFFTVR